MIIKNIAKEIQETLKAKERALQRQEQDPNNPIDGTLTFTDMAARTVFVRMASNATNHTHVQLLQNGAMSVSGKGFYNSEAYKDSGGGQIMPISGIKDISVEYKGGYKAIRRATVNWTAGSIQELDRLTAHFLSIGRTVMLDWGWVYPEREGGYGAERNKLIQQNSFWNGFNTDEHPIDQRIFEEGAVNILKNKGDYDAIGGLVSNFDYTLNEDGTFDCTTIITSTGVNIFDSKRIDKDGDTFVIKKSANKEESNEPNIDNLVNAIINLPRIVAHNYLNIPVDQKTINDMKLGYFMKSSLYYIIGHLAKHKANEQNFFNVSYVGGEEHGYYKASNFVVRDREEHNSNIVISKMSTYFHYSAWPFLLNPATIIPTLGYAAYGEATTGISQFGKITVNAGDRTDMFVRWGWFEDNVLSRYVSFVEDKDKDKLVAIFRSVETRVDDQGNPIIDEGNLVLKDVEIRNNSKLLIPKDPMKFILPGQNITSDIVSLTDQKVKDESGKLVNNPINDEAAMVFDKLMGINKGSSQNRTHRFKVGNGRFGKLRNVLINVKEIQKAFGIKKPMADYSYVGDIFGADMVNPPADVKTAMKNLCQQFTDNYHGYWKFEIVEDTFNKNIKIIDIDTISSNMTRGYTEFEGDKPMGDNTIKPKTHKVQKLGIYKFPSYKLGSMVKNQDLSFKIPDSMAVTIMYGQNKEGTRYDLTQNGQAGMSLVEKASQTGYIDKKLSGIEPAYLRDSVEGHAIGNSNSDTLANDRITLKNAFNIFVDELVAWWNVWSPNQETSYTGGSSWKFWSTEESQKEDFENDQKTTKANMQRLTNQFSDDLGRLIGQPMILGDNWKEWVQDPSESSRGVDPALKFYHTKKGLEKLEDVIERMDTLKANYEAEGKLSTVSFQEDGTQVQGATKYYDFIHIFGVPIPLTNNSMFGFKDPTSEVSTVVDPETGGAGSNLTQFTEDYQKLSDELHSILGNSDYFKQRLATTYYEPHKSDEEGFLFKLMKSAHSVVRDKLFAIDTLAKEYQKDFLIPAELTFTVDGIGGIFPGDITQIDYIQSRYNQQVVSADNRILGPLTFFQIFNTVQKVSVDNWETEIQTKMRVNNDALEGLPVASPKVTKNKTKIVVAEIVQNKVKDVDEDEEGIAQIPEITNNNLRLGMNFTFKRKVTPVNKDASLRVTGIVEKDKLHEDVGIPKDPTGSLDASELDSSTDMSPTDIAQERLETAQREFNGITTFRGLPSQNMMIYKLVPAWTPTGAGGSKNTSFYNERPEDKIPLPVRQLFWDNYCEMHKPNGVSELDVSTDAKRSQLELDLALPTRDWPQDISELVKYNFMSVGGGFGNPYPKLGNYVSTGWTNINEDRVPYPTNISLDEDFLGEV
tara:strand:- start:760 stop:4869 length:4110 start_codon:yes stop_codon:yes gene_type:complete